MVKRAFEDFLVRIPFCAEVDVNIHQRIGHLAEEVGGISALAALSGISRTGIQGCITRGDTPSQKTLLALAEATACPWEWLTKGIGPAPKIQPEHLRLMQGAVADAKPTGLRRLTKYRGRNNSEVLSGVAERVQAALAKADPDALAAAVPNTLLAAYAAGIAIPGRAHLSAIAAAARMPEKDLLGDVE